MHMYTPFIIFPLMLLAFLLFLSLLLLHSFLRFQQLNEICFVVLISAIRITALNNTGLELDAEGVHVSSPRLNGCGSE
jgi:hypothetical protein